jgi:hypothetical protein
MGWQRHPVWSLETIGVLVRTKSRVTVAKRNIVDAKKRALYFIRFGEYARAIEALTYALTKRAFLDGLLTVRSR